ncbi:MAG: YraN family protein [Verrucomicrobiaceae bacterium]|nr:YraN family protein [Verrucomicrobiaceae bacterium]
MALLDRPELLYRWARRKLATQPIIRRVCIWFIARPQRAYQPTLLQRRLSSAEIGQMGEWIACRWLRSSGRKVFTRNFKAVHGGEVDIVARHGKVLTFVEVKTRTRDGPHRPADAVGPEKQRLIIRGARDWLAALSPMEVPFRFDIAEIILIPGELPRVHIIENAFHMPDNSTLGR